jgi:hypothetical protein
MSESGQKRHKRPEAHLVRFFSTPLWAGSESRARHLAASAGELVFGLHPIPASVLPTLKRSNDAVRGIPTCLRSARDNCVRAAKAAGYLLVTYASDRAELKSRCGGVRRSAAGCNRVPWRPGHQQPPGAGGIRQAT